MVGQRIGKYRVTDQIGRGGMGTVFRARDETLHRDVAIKILNTELNDPSVARRFRAEAVTVARLNHPGIAIIYELLEHEGQWLMVMEYVRGETLEHLVSRQGALPIEQATDLCAQALSALAHAHALGVVHRDLKPANLMVNEAGAVKIMDFGISRVAGSEHLTSAGFMLGTPAYMAPEQVLGHDIDARTDLYAMGVVLYHLTTGRLPFKGGTPLEMAQSRINDSPTPIRSIRSDVPVWLGQVLDRVLAHEPADRFQSTTAFRDALRRGAANLPIDMSRPASTAELIATAAPRSLAISNRLPRFSADTPTLLPTSLEGATAPLSTGALSATAVIEPPPTPQHAAPDTGSAHASTSRPVIPEASKARGRFSPRTTLLTTAAVVLVGIVSAVRPWLLSTPVPAGGTRTREDARDTSPEATQAAAPGLVGEISGRAGPMNDVVSAESAAKPASLSPAPSPPHPTLPAITGSSVAAPPTGRETQRQSASITAAAGSKATGVITAVADTRGRSGPAEAPAIFAGVRVLVVSGRKAEEQDATLQLQDGHLTVLRGRNGPPLGTLAYTDVNSAAYARAKHPKWWPTLAGPPPDIDLPGGLFTRDRHWLALQSRTSYLILRLSDSDFRQVIDAVTARTGRPISRIP